MCHTIAWSFESTHSIIWEINIQREGGSPFFEHLHHLLQPLHSLIKGISLPEVRFAQAEAQFNIWSITVDETKYFFIIFALDQDTATCLLNFISPLLPDSKYTVLKERLFDILCLRK